MSITEIERQIREEALREVALQFTSIDGAVRTLWVPADDLPRVAEVGIHTDGSSLCGVVDVSRSDVKLKPDLASFVVLPKALFPQGVGQVMCDVYEPESDVPFAMDPRYILKRSVDAARERLGASVSCYTASEIEYFLLYRDDDGDLQLIDEGNYLATPPADRGADLRLEIAEVLRGVGLTVEKHHHEVPHGKSEFNLKYSRAVDMADAVYLVKFIIKLMAARAGLIASFMPKPFHGEYGAGLHTHISLIDDESGQNLFAAGEGSVLSKTGTSFLAGILAHARGLAGITNPSVNSYKRLVPGWEAPVNISWALYNRSVLVRIPPGRGTGTRLEYRPTDGSCNFYLAYAALLSAGLEGIRRQLEPPAAVEEDIYKMTPAERAERGIEVLPGNLNEALQELAQDEVLTSCLGDALSDKFLDMKRKEWMEYSTIVHSWERKKYLDV